MRVPIVILYRRGNRFACPLHSSALYISNSNYSWNLIALLCWYLLVLISSLVQETNRSLVVHDCYVIFALSHWPALVVKTNEYQWVPRQKCYKISAIKRQAQQIQPTLFKEKCNYPLTRRRKFLWSQTQRVRGFLEGRTSKRMRRNAFARLEGTPSKKRIASSRPRS